MEGAVAISAAGHDKGKLYVVLRSDDKTVLLADGRQRPLRKPKRKNRKHVFVLDRVSGYYEECMRGQKQLTDNGLRHELVRLKNLLIQGG